MKKTIILALMLAAVALSSLLQVSLPKTSWTVSALGQDTTAQGTRYRIELRAANPENRVVNGSVMFWSSSPFDGYAIGQSVTMSFLDPVK